MAFFVIEDNALVFRNNGETVRLMAWGEDALRISATMSGRFDEELYGLLPRETETAEIEICPRTARITNGRLNVELTLDGWGLNECLHMRFLNGEGDCLLEELSAGGALAYHPRQYRALEGGSFRLKVSFTAADDEKIYGMGQYQQERMNLKGCSLELAHRNSQASIPFYLSSKGYGFLWNNPAVGAVHFGTNRTEWEAEMATQIDYWIVAGSAPKAIQERYAEVTGKPPMMPEYGLGYWQCKLRYYNQEQVLDIAGEYKRRGIRLDVLVIDYYHWLRCGDWRFDPEYFPDPAAMVQALKDMGIETMVSVWPQVDWRSENYEEMRQQNLLVRSASGVDVQMLFHGNNVFLDATNPRTRAYVWAKIKQNYADLGIKSFWLDEAEPEFSCYDFENYRYYAGRALQVTNLYPREYARLFYEGQSADGQCDIVNLLRCAWVGSQRFAALVWSGDIMSTYEDMRKQICAGLHMGIAGIPWWTTDIGGFHNGDVNSPDFRELLIRWFQFGTFLPVMRMHGSRKPHEQIINKAGEVREQTGAPNEVWSYGEENYLIMKKYIEIRELMRDYVRASMRQAHEKGSPVMRSLFYEFPEDELTWDLTDQYLLGEAILVAPICQLHAHAREVYLPKGASWTNAHTGEVFTGGRMLEVEAPIDVIPIFLREGQPACLVGKI